MSKDNVSKQLISAEDVFNANDFSGLEFDIILKNLSTERQLNPVSLVEFTETGLILDLPAKSVNKTQNLMVDIFKKQPKPAPNSKKKERPLPLLSATSKVIETENTDSGEIRTTIRLIQFEEKQWEEFKNMFAARQDEIDNFFKSVRGY